MQNERRSISFVIPCLNEQETLPAVLSTIRTVCAGRLAGRETEIVVADNGSTDGSVEIAVAHGARVVHCAERGYGAALQAGIVGARHDLVVFADADNTYDFAESPDLVESLEESDCDLVFGSRLQGRIHRGAMPFLHRFVGTPVLNLFINLLHARGNARITDCNSGFRCFKRQSFLSWEVKSTGMEFASEMLVKALNHGASVGQVPITLRPDSKGRVPHLKTWRDGMRHLLQIFLGSPNFFHVVGVTVWAASWVAMLLGLWIGPFSIGWVSVFGIHSMMFALLGTLLGLQLWGIGLLLVSRRADDSLMPYRAILALPEDRLFWYSVVFVLLGAVMFAGIVVQWAINGFRELALEKPTLVFISFGANALTLVSNVITAHMLKRV